MLLRDYSPPGLCLCTCTQFWSRSGILSARTQAAGPTVPVNGAFCQEKYGLKFSHQSLLENQFGLTAMLVPLPPLLPVNVCATSHLPPKPRFPAPPKFSLLISRLLTVVTCVDML